MCWNSVGSAFYSDKYVLFSASRCISCSLLFRVGSSSRWRCSLGVALPPGSLRSPGFIRRVAGAVPPEQVPDALGSVCVHWGGTGTTRTREHADEAGAAPTCRRVDHPWERWRLVRLEPMSRALTCASPS